MIGNSNFGFSGGGSGGGGGTITGGGTVNTLAMFTPTGTAIGDSIVSQSVANLTASTFGSVNNSIQIGQQNVVNANTCVVVGYDLQSYIGGDMMFGTTIHVDPAAIGSFNYWLGGDYTVAGTANQNIANLYHSTIQDSDSSILYGHFNSYTTITSSNLISKSSSFTTVATSNFHVSNSTITGDGTGLNGGLGNLITFTATNRSYAFGDTLAIGHSRNILLGYGLTSTVDSQIILGHASTNQFIVNPYGYTYSATAQTSGATSNFVVTQAANTGQTASTEINGTLWTTTSRQWATGAITTQREFYITSPTYSFVGASVITNAYTLYIDTPTVGANATITNKWALGANGNAIFSNIGTGTLPVSIQGLVGSLTLPTLYMGQTTPNATNYTLLNDGSISALNSPTFLVLKARATNMLFMSSDPTLDGVTAFNEWMSLTVTGQTASTERRAYSFAAPNITFATGAITTQRNAAFTGAIYNFVGASVITNAATLDVTAATAGVNATITNNYSARFNGGNGIQIQTGSLAGQGIVIRDMVSVPSECAIYMGVTPSSTNYILRGVANTSIINYGTIGSFIIQASGNNRAVFNNSDFSFSPALVTATATTSFTFTNPANTNQTASTEIPSFKYNGGSRQWATGAITTQREWYQTTTTYTALGASVITDAYGQYIEAPTASTNITITNNWSLGLNANAQISLTQNARTQLRILNINNGTNSAASVELYANAGNATIAMASASNTQLYVQRALNFENFDVGGFAFRSPTGLSSGALSWMSFSPQSNTGQTASTEIPAFNYVAYSRQWATGAITTQREHYIRSVTYSFVGASVITNAYGYYVEAPTAGTNATITFNWAAGFIGSVKITGGITYGYVTKTSGYTFTGLDYTVDCTSGTFTLTLPTAVGRAGQVFVAKNTGAGTITMATTSSQTIDGAAPSQILTINQSYTFQSTGSNWIII